MRTLAFLVVILAGLAAPATIRAGLYNTAEPEEGKLDPNFRNFRVTLFALESIAMLKWPELENTPPPPPLRRRYHLQAELFPKVNVSKLSAEEKLNFSAVLIRRRQDADAIQLLMAASREHADHFLLLSHLSTAYHHNGDRTPALDAMEQCLTQWPTDWTKLEPQQREFLSGIGWNEGPFGFYREVETYYRKLLRLRLREPQQKGVSFEAVDALFDVKFIGESGDFEPGKIKASEKLPPKALDIVQQLLIWLPEDARLHWLLAEVLNARGEVKAARSIMDDLVYNRGQRAKALMERRRVISDFAEPGETKIPFEVDVVPTAPPAAVDWRGLVVSFGAGMLVALLGYWQIREIRRRRQT